MFGLLVKSIEFLEDGFKIDFSFGNKSSETFIWLCRVKMVLELHFNV